MSWNVGPGQAITLTVIVMDPDHKGGKILVVRINHNDSMAAATGKQYFHHAISQESTPPGTPGNPYLALKYFELVRDMFYCRVTSETVSLEFIRNVVHESRTLVQDLVFSKPKIMPASRQ